MIVIPVLPLLSSTRLNSLMGMVGAVDLGLGLEAGMIVAVWVVNAVLMVSILSLSS